MKPKDIDKEIKGLRAEIDRLWTWRRRCKDKYGGFEQERFVKNRLRQLRRRVHKLILLKGQN